MNEHFCTCTDKNCPNNPCNHKEGCSPCIRKNLVRKEIPSCFFNLLDSTTPQNGYSFEDFAKLVLKQK